MPKVHSESLFRLIQSLSKSEKRSFKLFLQRTDSIREKKILLLFDQIEKHKVYDEKRILKKENSLSAKQFPNLKAHLYKQILKSLAATSSLRIAELRVTNLLDYARLLYNKCLYLDCLDMIEKAKRAAEKYDTRVLLIEILELEKLALRQTAHEDNESKVETIILKTNETARRVQNINTFSNLALKLNSIYQRIGFIRNNEDFLQTKKIFQDALPSYTLSKLSFHEKLYLFYAYTGYYFFIQDFKKGYTYAKKWAMLFSQKPEMIYRKTELYIKALNSLLVAENKLNLYPEFKETHRKLISLKRDSKLQKSENINMNLFKTIYLHEINRHFMLGEFTSGVRIVKKLETELNQLIPKLDNQTILIFYYKIACLYFGASNFKQAIRWLSKIINEKETELREDLHAFARILRLICYFELGDSLVEHNLKSTYRFMLSKHALGKYQSLILDFIRKSKSYSTQQKLTQAFVNLKSSMEKLQASRFEKRAFLYFDIISWLESRIYYKPVEEIIRRKKRG